MPFFVTLLMFLVSLTACIPHANQSGVANRIKPHLLQDFAEISQIKLMEGQAKRKGSKGKVFEFAGKRLKREAERLLRIDQRWGDSDGLTLHIEIENVRLRKDAAVLMLWSIAGQDEMRIKVWITKDGEVIASERVSSLYDAGGTYATQSTPRRLELLSDQVARKMVKRL